MEKLGNVISRFMMGQRYERRSRQGPIFDRWHEVVGDHMAKRCLPVAVKKGVLVVHVADSVWMQELQMQKMEILERIREMLGMEDVVDVRWTIRGEAAHWNMRTRRSGPEAPPPRELNTEEQAWIQAVSAQVSDEGIQESVKRLLTKYLQRR
jgi:predicted nucleic acid-binding Zn ribbon protein